MFGFSARTNIYSTGYVHFWTINKVLSHINSAFYPTIDNKYETSIGDYVLKLLKELDHYQLRLPRIPTKINKEIQQKLASRIADNERQ